MTDMRTVETFENLLDEEHDALINGDFERIAELMQEKQGLVEKLPAVCDRPEALTMIRDRMARNHRLFDQSLAGLRNVASHLGVLAHVRKTLSTYNGKGQKETLTGQISKRLEKRA
jgi:flagellar biosynthesis/type III secretory pathway chaperone